MFKGCADNEPTVEKLDIGKLINMRLSTSLPLKTIGEGSVSHPVRPDHAQGQGQEHAALNAAKSTDDLQLQNRSPGVRFQ